MKNCRGARGWARLALAAGLVAVAGPARVAEAGRAWIEDPTGRGVLQVAFREMPTYEDLAEAQAALTRAAQLLCDATDGQVRISQVRLVASPAAEDVAALWYHDDDAASGGPYGADGGDLRRLGAHMDVFASARLRPDRLAHLIAHHAFGLGDQYDDQRRRGGACGIGPGFETSLLDEGNHSLMQAAGGMRCLDGPLLGQECLRDDQCAGSACRAVLASEFSIPRNHDLLRGDGNVCPRPSASSRVRLDGVLPARTGLARAFDGADFLAARATSAWHEEVEVFGPSGSLPGLGLHFYLSHLSRLVWQLTVAGDAGDFGGKSGELLVLRSWTLTFNDDFSLAGVSPGELRLELPPSGGRGPAVLAIDLGSRNPHGRSNPGEGFDGLQMVTAGALDVDVRGDGVVGCTAGWCASSWNERTGRWELSEQSLLHEGASDWRTLATNLPFVVPPLEGVTADPPAVCQAAPEFFTEVLGADQVLLVLDTSTSTGTRTDGRAGEVCANGTDDDADGAVDEEDCADSRLEYERLAARVFLELADSRELQVGVLSMHTDAEIVSGIESVDGPRRAVLGAMLGSLVAEGDTAIGTSLERAQEALQKFERAAGSRYVILMSDGANNVGVAPGQEKRLLDPLLYRVFTVAIGSAADQMTLSAVAARSGGVAYGAARANDAPAILAELAARHAGSSPVLQRTPFDLARPGEARAVATSIELEIPVEEKAGELVVYLGTRNDRIDDWRLLFELRSPDGMRIDDTSGQAHVERGFVVVRVLDPRPGRWALRVLPGGRGVQHSDVVAWTLQPNADFFADADPRLASVGRSVRISARPSYVSDIDGDVAIDGVVRRPDGSETPVELERDPITQAWGATFDAFSGRGLYEVRLRLRVGEDARPALGEPVFPGPSRVLRRVVPLERHATASFFVADGGAPPCAAADCDDDGLPDALETGCPDDADGDGMPNRFDADSDNDEIFDGAEGTGDADQDGIPDWCDAEAAPDSLAGAIEAEEAAIEAACGQDAAGSRERLRASLSAIRRIVQVLRTKPGVPAAERDDLVGRLEQAIRLKKQASVIGEVLPEFCRKFQARLEDALVVERELQVRVDAFLMRPSR